jgi:glycosyltransferase involved in cell wall biosynthesis
MNITVVVPTYKRPTDLIRCLEALKRQILRPHEVIVVVRNTDLETWSVLDQFSAEDLPLKTQKVTVPGVVAAMNLGLEAATGDAIAFTDDDAAPHPDWLQRIAAHFASDPRVGGVGGRDIIQNPKPWFLGSSENVGRLQWFGRMIGNHHKGIGSARPVDILKGVNMSFRRAAIGNLRFDSRMLGSGAQVHFEVAFCLTLKRRGWTLIYDPAVQVDHHLAQRFDEDQRYQFNAVAYFNLIHNETLALVDHFAPAQQAVFLLWAALVGTRDAYGLAQMLRFLPKEGSIAGQKWLLGLKARLKGWQTSHGHPPSQPSHPMTQNP